MTVKDREVARDFLSKQESKVASLAKKCNAQYFDHLGRWVFPRYSGDGSWDGKSLVQRDFCKQLAVPEELSLLLQDAYRLGALDLANHLGGAY